MATALEDEEYMPMWQECLDWLLRWKIIPQQTNCTITDLPHILKDGVLLCKLLHKMDENSINMEQVFTNPTDSEVFLHIFSLYGSILHR